MSSLIKNEIIKIFKKKSIYVMLIITFAFIILTNILYKFIIPKLFNFDTYDEYMVESIKRELSGLNINDPEEAKIYVSDKTALDIMELSKKYDSNSWQYAVVQEKAQNLIYQINYFKYIDNNSELLEEAKKDYDAFVEILNQNNWRKIVEAEIEELKQNTAIIGMQGQDEMFNLQLEVLQMRLDYNIEYGNNYRNDALSRYYSSKIEIQELEQVRNKTYAQKKQYQELKEELETSKYIIQNNIDISTNENTRDMLLSIFSEYGLFMVITVVLIAGTIVSEEFNKGTIKLLLVKPYSRNKILLAKLITVFLITLFIILAIIIMQFIIGAIFYGLNSLTIPQIVYNHNTGEIQEVSFANALLKEIIGNIPLYLLIGTLAFTISATLNSTAVAITVSLLGYMASGIVNQVMYSYNVKIVKYFVTANWNLTEVFDGKLHAMEGITLPFSIIICLIYFLIMIIPAFMVFKKKNIKNI